MKKIFFALLFLSVAYGVKAQMPANAQQQMQKAQQMLKQMQSNPQVQAALQKAQHIMDSLKTDTGFQNQMAKSRHDLDSLKKTNPALANISMPDFNNMQMPNLDSLGNMLNSASQQMQAFTAATFGNYPKVNLLHHAEELPKLTPASLTASVSNIVHQLKPKFDFMRLDKLNSILKDKKVNSATIGALLLTTGADKNAALYLIGNRILQEPKDTWAVNDLGVYYRYSKDYENALKCFFYADSLDGGKSKIIHSNIGWAAAYYGDFNSASKYFNKVLAVDSIFTYAAEGEATIDYVQGDLGALWRILAREVTKIKLNSSVFDDGLSDDFATTCAMEAGATENLDNQTTDPNNDHTFDNPNPENDHGINPPPGAWVDDIPYSRYKNTFISDPKQLLFAWKDFVLQVPKTTQILRSRSEALSQELKTLKPLVQAPYIDTKGNLVHPASFQKYVELCVPVEVSFEERRAWYKNKFEKKLAALGKDVAAHDNALFQQYMNTYNACIARYPKNDFNASTVCQQEADCQWIPKMYSSKNGDLEAIIRLWNDYYEHVAKAIQWYLDASAPLVSRVHDAAWNQYLNDRREWYVRTTIISAYEEWGAGLETITLDPVSSEADNIVNGGEIAAMIIKPPPACPVLPPPSESAPNPFSLQPQRIKEFEGPCYQIKESIVVLGFVDDCHGSTFYIGTPPGELNPLPISLSAFYTQTTDPIAAQNQGYSTKIGGSIEVGPSVGVFSAGADIGGDLQFNNNWQVTGGSVNGGLELDAANASLNIGPQATFKVAAGQLQDISFTTSATPSVH